MGKKVTYERWITLFLPDGWNEREEMGCVFLEKDGWPGLMQFSFMELPESKTPPAETARVLLEDTLEERDIPFPREAIRAETNGMTGTAVIDYVYREADEPAHWRIWYIIDKTRAILAAYVCDPEHDGTVIDEASRIIADMEFIPA